MAPSRNNTGAELSGMAAELRQLKTDSGESLAELQAFLNHTRGKSPQEVLGIVANTGLFGSTALATVLIALGIALFTIGPYAIWGTKPTSPAAATTAPDTVEQARPTAPSKTGSDVASTTPKSTASTNGDEAVDALGIGETKAADPKVNPLENDLEDLLDSIK